MRMQSSDHLIPWTRNRDRTAALINNDSSGISFDRPPRLYWREEGYPEHVSNVFSSQQQSKITPRTSNGVNMAVSLLNVSSRHQSIAKTSTQSQSDLDLRTGEDIYPGVTQSHRMRVVNMDIKQTHINGEWSESLWRLFREKINCVRK